MRYVALVALFAAASSSACEPAPKPPVSVALRVTTNRGRPVVGAEVRLPNGAVAARSNAEGKALLEIGGRDGDSFAIRVQCPAPLRSPARPIVVRRLAIEGGSAEHAVKCEEPRRTLVVAVRATAKERNPSAKASKTPKFLDLPSLPILYLGKPVGYTDRSGAAHVKIDVDTREHVELVLDTKGADMARAHPQNPHARFEPAEHDEVRVFENTFTIDAIKKPKPRGRPPIIRIENH